MAAPQDYPCYTEDGYYKPTSWDCQEKCCVLPAITPEGEDTPKWSATVAARMEDKEPVRQPDFGCETPPKTVLPKDYDPTTGWTPYSHGNPFNARLNCDRPGVPGHSIDNPFYLDTPTRDKKSGKSVPE